MILKSLELEKRGNGEICVKYLIQSLIYRTHFSVKSDFILIIILLLLFPVCRKI